MAFNICPAHWKVQNLFKACPEKLLRTRTPLPIRATEAYKNRTVTPQMALKFATQNLFELGTNRFDLENNSRSAHEGLIALTLSHFGSAFRDSFIFMWAEDTWRMHPSITIKAFRGLSTMNGRIPKLDQEADLLGRIEFVASYTDNCMILGTLRSEQPGCGGRMLLAAYNTAKDLDLKNIDFYVETNNTNAKQFYFYMDFGAPQDHIWHWWKVDVLCWQQTDYKLNPP